MTLPPLIARIRPEARVRWVLCTLMFGLVIFLLLAPKPWAAEFADRDRLKVADYVAIGSWWAALVNLVPLAVLAGSAKFWLRPLQGSNEVAPSLPNRWFLPLVALAMVVCAAVNAPRLGFSLWDDEEYSLRRVVLGSYRITSEGEPRLKEVPWTDTLWYYSKPNNHIVNSVAARVSNTVWRWVARPTGLQFSETALRLPAFLAGVLSICVWALLLRGFGFSRAGILVAWLIALHPWHSRFVPEMRGYAFVFLALPLACWLAVRAIRGGGWGRWSAYGAAQVLLFFSWPGTAFTLAVLNLCVLALVVHSRRDIVTLLSRWVVVTAAAGMLCFQLYLPCAAQLVGHLNDWTADGIGQSWLNNVGSRLLIGMPWQTIEGTFPQAAVLIADFPLLIGGAMILIAALILLGLGRCAVGGIPTICLALILVLPGPATYVFARIKDTHLFEWYMVFMVPGIMALCALGLDWLLGRLRNPRVAAVAAGLILAVFAAATFPARQRLMNGPVQFLRESVLVTRPTLDPNDPRNREILTVATLATPEVYDPNIRRLKTGEELVELIREADRTGRPLYVNQGYSHILVNEAPDLAAVIMNPDYFEVVATLPGLDSMFDREIRVYRAGSLPANFSPD